MSSNREVVAETVRNAISTDPSFQLRWESMVNDLTMSDSVNDPQSIAFQIRKSGILDQIVRKLRHEEPSPNTAFAKTADINSQPISSAPEDLNDFLSLESIPIQISIKRGSGFVDYMSADLMPKTERPVLQLVCCFNGNRLVSDLYLASAEIVFSADTQFAFNTPLPSAKSSTTWRTVVEYLLNTKQVISVYLLEYRQTNESWIPALKMHGALEWRHCLHTSLTNQPLRVELKGIGEVAQQGLGVLEVEARIGSNLPAFVTADVVELQLTVESSKRTEADRAFINYARLWHKDFIELSPVLLARRAVKLFVHDERGAVRFPSSFIQILPPGRLIDTPQKCARFVGLFGVAPRELQAGNINEQDDVWFSIEASLISSTTTSGGRAVLLCSFLLGMGLDAYVCIGRASSIDVYEEEEVVRIWVITITPPSDPANGERVTFWDPMTGVSFLVRPKSMSVIQQCCFRTVECVFRHDLFLANIQSENRVVDVSFEFNDNEKWRALDVSTCPQIEPTSSPTLQPWSNRRFGNNYCAMADWLEEEFARLFAEHRHNLELPRVDWDQRLSTALGIALSNYEMTSTFGSNFAMPKDFLSATRNLVPQGCVLRAVPMQLPLESVACPTRAFTSALTRCQAARDVVELPGHMVRAALRVTVVPYAERIAAVWVMLASYSK